MEWTGILSVVERQEFESRKAIGSSNDPQNEKDSIYDFTACKTTVTFVSKLGQAKAARRRAEADSNPDQQEQPRQGFFSAWSTAGIQRTVELVGVKRTKTALMNGKEGMNVVLERLREGGIVAVVEAMRREHMEIMGGEGPWKQVWMNGTSRERSAPKGNND